MRGAARLQGSAVNTNDGSLSTTTRANLYCALLSCVRPAPRARWPFARPLGDMFVCARAICVFLFIIPALAPRAMRCHGELPFACPAIYRQLRARGPHHRAVHTTVAPPSHLTIELSSAEFHAFDLPHRPPTAKLRWAAARARRADGEMLSPTSRVQNHALRPLAHHVSRPLVLQSSVYTCSHVPEWGQTDTPEPCSQHHLIEHHAAMLVVCHLQTVIGVPLAHPNVKRVAESGIVRVNCASDLPTSAATRAARLGAIVSKKRDGALLTLARKSWRQAGAFASALHRSPCTQ